MKAFIISDKDYQTEVYQQLDQLVHSYFEARNFQVEEVQVGRGDLAYCMGCFGCWIKKPGECVINDKISQINRKAMNSDAVVFLNPVIFGQFSANMKNAVDRWLPNVLPFFITRSDGSTMHPDRYSDHPKQIMIGYGDDLCEEDEQLFIDISKKHRPSTATLIYKSGNTDFMKALDKIEMKREGGYL